MSHLEIFKVVEVLDPQKHGDRVYKLEGKDIPERDNVILDFSALPTKTRQEEMSLFHHINDDGTVTVRIHRCKFVKSENFPELTGNERYAFEAREQIKRNRKPRSCARCST